MDDRQLMENMLLLEKGACDLLMHGTVESSSPNVHQAFSCSLNSSLQMQEQIYEKMHQNRTGQAEVLLLTTKAPFCEGAFVVPKHINFAAFYKPHPPQKIFY